MTLNAAVTLTPMGAGRAVLVWTAPNATDLSWININGEQVAGPLAPGAAAREAEIAFPDGGAAEVEVHDLPAGSSVCNIIAAEPNVRPYLEWSPVSDADRYRVHHREGESGDEERILNDQAPTTPAGTITRRCPERLNGVGGVWHHFRVEAVDEAGNESERELWPYYVTEPPEPATAVAVAGSGGSFTITLTP